MLFLWKRTPGEQCGSCRVNSFGRLFCNDLHLDCWFLLLWRQEEGPGLHGGLSHCSSEVWTALFSRAGKQAELAISCFHPRAYLVVCVGEMSPRVGGAVRDESGSCACEEWCGAICAGWQGPGLWTHRPFHTEQAGEGYRDSLCQCVPACSSFSKSPFIESKDWQKRTRTSV